MYPTIFCHFYFLCTQNKYLVRKSIYNEAEGFVWLVLNPLSAKKVQSESDYISARASPSSFILSFPYYFSISITCGLSFRHAQHLVRKVNCKNKRFFNVYCRQSLWLQKTGSSFFMNIKLFDI